MIIDNRYYRIKSIFGYRLRALTNTPLYWYLPDEVWTRVWRIYSNIWIFKYFGHKYLFGHSFVSIFLYKYSRIFVYECVTVWNLVEYSNIFTYLYNFPCEHLFRYYIMSNFLNKYVRTFVGKIYLIQIYSDFHSCSNFQECPTLVWGPMCCTTHADITLYISQIPDTCISSFIPLISPKHPPDITKISPRYPRFIHLNTSPRYLQDIHHIYPRHTPDIEKIP